jgi:hypothetical protein
MKEGKVFLSQIKTLSKLVLKDSNPVCITGIYFEERGGYMKICVPFVKENELWEYVISGPNGGYVEHRFEGVLALEG